LIHEKIVSGNVKIGKLGMYLQAQTEKGYDIRFDFVKLPELSTIGVSNITVDQSFVLFLDYDKMSREQLEGQMKFLSGKYGTNNFFIMKTGEHRYHLICFEKFGLPEIQDIVNNTLCDYSFKITAVKSDKGWILRLYPKIDEDGNVVREKPEFVEFVSYGNPGRKQSRAHLEMFSKLYPEIKIIFSEYKQFDEEFLDSFTTVYVVKYGTSHANILPASDMVEFVKSKNLQVVWEDGGTF